MPIAATPSRIWLFSMVAWFRIISQIAEEIGKNFQQLLTVVHSPDMVSVQHSLIYISHLLMLFDTWCSSHKGFQGKLSAGIAAVNGGDVQ